MTHTDSLKRFDRIVALLIHLQSKQIVRAQDLADRFQVSLRTIYRDVKTLENAGVPIISEAGIGYSIMEGYRLPPVMFTRAEAGSFVAAEKLMQHFTDKSLGKHYESAMFKLKSILRGKEKDWVSVLENQILIDPAQRLFNDSLPNGLELIFESIAEKTQLALTYQSLTADSPLKRLIEPVGLFHENNYWYIMAYCHKRKAYRQFRTDRMMTMQATVQQFTREHAPLSKLIPKNNLKQHTKIRILVDKPIVNYIESSKHYHGFHTQVTHDNQVEMTFFTSDIHHGFAHWLMSFAEYVDVLEPQDLRQKMLHMATNIQQRFSAKKPGNAPGYLS